MSDDDMIRRGDAILAVTAADKECLGANGAREFIRAIPAVTVGVRPLVWRDDGTNGHETDHAFGFYEVYPSPEGDMLSRDGVDSGVFPTLEAAKAAAQADYDARIRSALTAQPSPDVEALVDDAGLLLDAYKAVLVLHRVMEKHGLTAGASAAENIADRIVAAHPEFPGLCALRGTALARVKGGAA